MRDSQGGFSVGQIDHVELFVPDRYQAATWYQKTLGLKIVPECEVWAEDAQGPLMISSDSGSTKLALFQGEPQAANSSSGFHRVAFRAEGKDFVRFVESLSQGLELKDQHGETVSKNSVVDHDIAFSIYFCDPYGNRLEISTYDHDMVRSLLGG